MKGYKAFNHDMTCRGKQYAENTVFEEEEADICRKGMHFCKNPLECLNYYPLLDKAGNLVTIAEVEALDEVKTDDNKKFCTKKLSVGAKLDLKGIVNAQIEFVKNTCKGTMNFAQGYSSKAAAQGDYSKASADGESAIAAAFGKESMAKSSIGSWIVLSEHGDWDGKGYPVIGCVAAQIDGETLKADTRYTLKNGVITEVTE